MPWRDGAAPSFERDPAALPDALGRGRARDDPHGPQIGGAHAWAAVGIVTRPTGCNCTWSPSS
ncbi:type III secretion protein HpaP [Burkholderia pseudomallei]|nr:type III secretion protein HpaP [Burkholderia pseudomallei]